MRISTEILVSAYGLFRAKLTQLAPASLAAGLHAHAHARALDTCTYTRKMTPIPSHKIHAHIQALGQLLAAIECETSDDGKA